LKEGKEGSYGGGRGEVTLIKREDCGLNDEKQNASRRCTNVYLN